MAWAIEWPWAGPTARVLRTRRSSVPWSNSPCMGAAPRFGIALEDNLLERQGANWPPLSIFAPIFGRWSPHRRSVFGLAVLEIDGDVVLHRAVCFDRALLNHRVWGRR